MRGDILLMMGKRRVRIVIEGCDMGGNIGYL